MREKLITLSYLYDGDIIKMTEAYKNNIATKINYKYIEDLDNKNISVITIVDDDYPRQLLELYNPPLVLYCLGNKKLLNDKMFAIIGSRKNSVYSKQVCKELVLQLEKDIVIVSGMAMGIDTFAHTFALKYQRNTIAVLGSGFNKIYPEANINLARTIGENHLLISEYPPNVIATKKFFPLRNRIIAALASNLYVIEAAYKSGSLITANIAVELGKNIYCAPGSIFDINYYGSHQLINDGAYLLELRNEVGL